MAAKLAPPPNSCPGCWDGLEPGRELCERCEKQQAQKARRLRTPQDNWRSSVRVRRR